MAATFVYQEDNGTATGSPAKGATRADASQVNWKSVDDIATAVASAPIVAGTDSYEKYQFGKFTGSFNEISNGLWAHVAGVLGADLTLVGKVTSTYATPSTAPLSGSSDMTPVIAITSGAAVLFHTTGPEGASPTSTLTAAGYTQYLVSQLQTGPNAVAGDTASVTMRLRYFEN